MYHTKQNILLQKKKLSWAKVRWQEGEHKLLIQGVWDNDETYDDKLAFCMNTEHRCHPSSLVSVSMSSQAQEEGFTRRQPHKKNNSHKYKIKIRWPHRKMTPQDDDIVYKTT